MPRAWYTSDRVQMLTRRLAAFVGIVVLLWIGSRIALFSPVYTGIQGTLYRASTGISRAASRLFANETSLTAQLAQCTAQMQAQTVTALHALEAQREVDEWRAVFSYAERTATVGIAARIIARQSPESSRVIIDRGHQHGIIKGAAVVIGDGLLYGVIHDVSEFTAVVSLTEDDSSIIAASILGKKKTIGLVVGQEGALLSMEYIPQDTRIVPGDIVMTSGLDGVIPEGLILGTVTEVVATPNAPFMHVMITPLHDPREWTSVLVLPPASSSFTL